MGKDKLNDFSLPSNQASKPESTRNTVLVKHVVLALAALTALSLFQCHGRGLLELGSDISAGVAVTGAQDAACVQVEPLVPVQNSELWNVTGAAISSESFKSRAVSWLADAVKIPCVLYAYLTSLLLIMFKDGDFRWYG